MEVKIRRHFDQIITSAKSLLNNTKIEEDISVKRALLKISGEYGSFEVKVTIKKYIMYLNYKDY